MTDLPDFLVPFAASAIAVAILTPFAKRIALKAEIVASPKADRWHDRPIPLFGGVAVYAAVILAGAVLGIIDARVITVLAAGSAMFAVGLVDDIVALKPNTKLTAQIGVACGVLVMGTGPRMDHVACSERAAHDPLDRRRHQRLQPARQHGRPVRRHRGASPALASLLGIDRCQPNPIWRRYAALLAGAGAGFLVYNFKPASIFMGDSGSLFLGFTSPCSPLDRRTPRPGTGVLSTLAAPGVPAADPDLRHRPS